MAYPFASIEKKWQEHWKKQKAFRTPTDRTRPKYYVLDMFPYPSGSGLHVGHPEGYTATDIIARYKRMRGYNVLHPMGWDAFGLPAERYAMQTNIHPSITTAENIKNFRRQLDMLGFSYDWEREIDTTDPKYYKWTQWIFLKIFNSWYDPEKKRARPIEELPLPAELDEDEQEDYRNSHRLAYIAEMPVNYCAELGTVLANEEIDEWTAKGYTVERRPMRQWMLRITAYAERLLDDLRFVDWPASTKELQKNWIGRSDGAEVEFPVKGKPGMTIRIFTTRPDTLYGCTYMVLAPEHPLTTEITTPERRRNIDSYVEQARKKSELDRTVDGDKEKSGVFTGAYAVHPLTGKDIPVWTADYVLMGYGTGAIMAVPAHDERDFVFATRYELPIRFVVRPASGEPDLAKAFTESGINFNSEILNGQKTDKATQTMIDHLEKTKKGRRRVNYKLRDWLFSRQRYWGEPVPVSFASDQSYVGEKPENLPLVLPPCEDFQPSPSGLSPLAKLKDWVEYKKGGRTFRRETNTMPQWAGSSWYYLRFIDPHNDKALVDPKEERYWMGDHGVDLYVGGAEHAVLHLLYARFWHKVLFDLGHVGTTEPFKKLIHQGLILGEDGSKMSKSLGNVVNPDAVVAEHGADTFRLFEMFLGPLEQAKPWSSNGLEGVGRFLSRVWRLYTLAPAGDTGEGETGKNAALGIAQLDPRVTEEPTGERQVLREKLIHKTIQKITEDIEKMSFNTAVSQLMIFVNETLADKQLGRFGAESFLLLLSPFAPHLAEELWALIGHKKSLIDEKWPAFDPAKTVEDEREIVFQVNGKLRGKARMPMDTPEDKMKEAALSDVGVKRAMEGKEPRKIIVIPNRLVNIVVG